MEGINYLDRVNVVLVANAPKEIQVGEYDYFYFFSATGSLTVTLDDRKKLGPFYKGQGVSFGRAGKRGVVSITSTVSETVILGYGIGARVDGAIASNPSAPVYVLGGTPEGSIVLPAAGYDLLTGGRNVDTNAIQAVPLFGNYGLYAKYNLAAAPLVVDKTVLVNQGSGNNINTMSAKRIIIEVYSWPVGGGQITVYLTGGNTIGSRVVARLLDYAGAEKGLGGGVMDAAGLWEVENPAFGTQLLFDTSLLDPGFGENFTINFKY